MELALFAGITVCVGIVTVELVLTLREMRRVFTGVQGILGRIRAVVDRADQASHAVETAVRRGYAAASQAMEHVEQWPSRLGQLLTRRWGNGVGVEPRRRSRAVGKRR